MQGNGILANCRTRIKKETSLSHAFGGSINWYICLEKLTVANKASYVLNKSNFNAYTYLREMSICPAKHMYSSIHHSLNNKSQKTETAQMFTNTRTNSSILECGILLVNVKE